MQGVQVLVQKVQQVIEDLAEIINEVGYSKQRIFSVDETTFYWKKMPSRHLAMIKSQQERRSQYLASKDRSNLRANAAGDLKLKPIFIYHSKSPRAIKNNAKSNLEQQGLDDSTFVYNIFFCLLNILGPLLRPTAQKRFQNNTAH